MKELTNLINIITDKIIEHNLELKKGNFANLKFEINNILQNMENLNIYGLNITNSSYYGMNIEFSGLTSNFLFPFFLYGNVFRLQIIKDLKIFIKKDFTIDQLSIFLSKKIFLTLDKKKGGFNERTLELLRFYIQTFEKVLDNSLDRYEQFLPIYKYKYHNISLNYLKTRFPLTQKYIKTYFIPNYNQFSISTLLLEDKENISETAGLRGIPLGIIYGDDKNKKFLLLNVMRNDVAKLTNKLIRKIIFFENLDLFYKNEKYNRYRNSVKDIFNLHEDYIENNLKNTALEYTIDFQYKNQKPKLNGYEEEILSHLFNTRKLPVDFEVHPILKNLFSYRNKSTTFYSSINYIIHIFDPNSKNLDRYSELLNLLLKNTFANGYIIQYKTGFLLSTNAFREDFERVKKEFQEFIWSFKLECQIYENLNYIPFSFYHLPNSQYYSNETNQWEFPVFEDKPVTEYFDHLAVNYRQEMKRLEETSFKARVDQTVERLTKEIAEIKEQQKKKNN